MTTAINTQAGVRPSLRMSEDEFIRFAAEEPNAEWVAGRVELKMSISSIHDNLAFWLRMLLYLFAEQRGLGIVKGPQFAMRLPQRPSRRDPDVMFVAGTRTHLLMPTVFNGPADLTVEIVSPESVARDYRDKYNEYEAAGVREYWIIDPLQQLVEAHTLTSAGKYEPIETKTDGTIHSVLLTGLWIKPAELFGETLPDVVERVKQMTV